MTTTTTTAGPSLAELLRGIQRYARIDAETGGHELGRWTREQTGRRDHRSSSARCSKCQGLAYAHVGPDGFNQRNGAAVLMRCPAVPGNRCQEMATPARTVELHDATGDSITANVACGLLDGLGSRHRRMGDGPRPEAV
jgi:hypothetical protein